MKSANNLLDLRVRRTYKFLWDALMALMSERDFDSIAVTEICERAMVHRTTFYKHYEDKNGLLFHGIQDELNALFETVDRAVANAGETEEHTMRLIAVFEHVLKRQGFYRLMLGGEGFGNFSSLLRKSLAERLLRRFQEEGLQMAMPMALHAQLQAAGIVTAVAWWLENDCPYTPIEMTDYLGVHFRLLPSSQHKGH
jgi:AcrR family transcriptional regulator